MSCQIHAVLAEQLAGVARAAGREHREVVVAHPRVAAEEALGEQGGGGDGRRVLEDVEVAVEVGDEHPLDGIGGVDGHDPVVGPVVAPQQRPVHAGHLLARQRLARLDRLVDGELELGEHHLPEEGAPDALEHRAQVEESLVVADVLAQQVLLQQELVGDGGDLGRERGIAARLPGLPLVGEPGVDGVPPLVGERREVGEPAVVVEQQVGVDVVDVAEHVRARRLPRLRVDVHPAALEPLAQQVLVVGAEGRGRRQGQGRRLVDAELAVERGQRRVDVVVVQVVEAQHAPADAEVAVQRRQVAAGRVEQGAVDGGGDVGAGQRRLQRAAVTPHPGVEDVGLHLRVEQLPEGRLVGLPGAPEPVEHELAVAAVLRRPVQGVGGLVEGHLLTGGQGDGGERHVRAGQQGVDALGALHHGAGGRDDLLGLVRQGVRRVPQGVAQVERVRGEARLLGDEALDRLRPDAQQLGRDERDGLAEPRPEGGGEAPALLRRRHPAVLVGLEERVDEEPRQLPVGGGDGVERLSQGRGALAEAPLVAGQRLDPLLEGGAGRVPGVDVGIDLAEVPLDLLGGGRFHGRGGGGGCRRHRQWFTRWFGDSRLPGRTWNRCAARTAMPDALPGTDGSSPRWHHSINDRTGLVRRNGAARGDASRAPKKAAGGPGNRGIGSVAAQRRRRPIQPDRNRAVARRRRYDPCPLPVSCRRTYFRMPPCR